MTALVQSFTVKQIRFTFTLSNNAVFAGTNSNVLMVTGLRASATIKNVGMPGFPEMELSVYGMQQQDMIALTALGFRTLSMMRNTVLVEANAGQGWSSVFLGQIFIAGPNYSDSPNVSLTVQARALGFDSLNPADPTSYQGKVAVATIVQNIVSRMGYVFRNDGVTAQLSNSYFPGTLTQQLRAVVQQAGISSYAEGNVITICPKGALRSVDKFILSPTSGLIGYPTLDYNRGMINVRALFNPEFFFGGPVQIVNSDVPQANGTWGIGTVEHHLESLQPGGEWFSDLLLYPPNLLPPIQ